MIGYIICPKKGDWTRKATTIISKLRTYQLLRSLESDKSSILLFNNSWPNSYFHDDAKYSLVATGTIVFNDKTGLEALAALSMRLKQGDRYPELYAHLRGPFNLICLDKENRQCFVFTDKEGLQSGFCSKKDDKSFFSSSLIIIAALLDAAIDLDSIRDFVSIGATVKGRTIFDGVYQMDSASMFMDDGGVWQQRKLWSIKVQENPYGYSRREIVDEFEKRLEVCLEFLKAYKGEEICTDLSGGTDSRTVLAMLLKLKGRVDVNVAGPEEHEDVVIHRKIANTLHLNSVWYPDPLRSFEVTSDKLEEAIEIADGTRNAITLMPALPFFATRAEKYKILLGGNGGPLFKDHYWLFEFNRIGRRREPNWRRIAHLSTVNYPWQDNVFNGGGREGDRLGRIYLNHSSGIRGTNNQKLDYVYFDLKMKAYHAPQFTTCNQFFDVYHPFCDGHLVEFSININPDIRKRANLQFSVIYGNNKDLAWIPTNNGCPAVPSLGRFFYLRTYVVLRYARALWRKIGMYVLRRNIVPSVYKMSSIYNQLMALGYVDKYIDLRYMRTRALFNEREFARMLENPFSSSNLDYLLNAMAVELTLERKESLAQGS